MKKHISAVLVLTLVVTALLAGFAGTALADGVDFTVSPTVSEMTAGGDVEFRYTIVNNNGDALPDFTVKYKASGAGVASGSTVPGGGGVIDSSFVMNVNDSMLGQTLTFELYSGGNKIAETSAKVNKKTLSVNLKASASANKELADSGESVTFTFKLENQGEAEITDIVVKASNLNSGKALKDKFSLGAGSDPFTFTYKHTMTADVSVTPTISYKANGVDQTPITLNPINVTLGKRQVEVVLTADKKNPQAGEDVTFKLAISNKGNVSYSDMKVSMNGEEVSFPTSNLKPGDALEETYKRSFETSTEVTFSVTMKDQNGEQKSVTSNAVQITLPVDASVVNDKLKLVMSVDRPQLTSAGTVNFSGYVTNATEYNLMNVQVNEASLGNIFSTSLLEAGGQAAIEWPADINGTTQYNFVLTASDGDGNTYTINAQPITVTVQSVEPTPTNFDDAADVTESGQVLDNGGGSFNWSQFFLILAIVLVVLIVGVGVALIILWRKGKLSGGRPSGGRPGTRPSSASSSSSTARKKPSGSYGRGGGPRKPTGTKSYRDRNNF